MDTCLSIFIQYARVALPADIHVDRVSRAGRRPGVAKAQEERLWGLCRVMDGTESGERCGVDRGPIKREVGAHVNCAT